MERSYVDKENSAVVFMAFFCSVGLFGVSAQYNRAIAGGFISSSLDGSGNCIYYDGCWCTGWYSFCHPWIFTDDKEYILVTAK